MISWFSSPPSAITWDYYTTFESNLAKSTWQLPTSLSWGTAASVTYRISTAAFLPLLFTADLFIALLKLSVGNALVLLGNAFSQAYFFLAVEEEPVSILGSCANAVTSRAKAITAYCSKVLTPYTDAITSHAKAIASRADAIATRADAIISHYSEVLTSRAKAITAYCSQVFASYAKPVISGFETVKKNFTRKCIVYPTIILTTILAPYFVLGNSDENLFRFYAHSVYETGCALSGTLDIGKGLLFMPYDVLNVITKVAVAVFSRNWDSDIRTSFHGFLQDFGQILVGVNTLCFSPLAYITKRFIDNFVP